MAPRRTTSIEIARSSWICRRWTCSINCRMRCASASSRRIDFDGLQGVGQAARSPFSAITRSLPCVTRRPFRPARPAARTRPPAAGPPPQAPRPGPPPRRRQIAHQFRAQDIEAAGNEQYGPRRVERGNGGRCQDFSSGIHAERFVPEFRAAAAVRSTETAVMQRWSMGHSRSRQGLHSACSRTTRASGPVGPVVVSSVAPKTATVGHTQCGCHVHGAGIVGQRKGGRPPPDR